MPINKKRINSWAIDFVINFLRKALIIKNSFCRSNHVYLFKLHIKDIIIDLITNYILEVFKILKSEK